MSKMSDIDLQLQEVRAAMAEPQMLDATLFQLEEIARDLLPLSETPEGIEQMLADDARWFGALLAMHLIGDRLTRHVESRKPARFRIVR